MTIAKLTWERPRIRETAFTLAQARSLIRRSSGVTLWTYTHRFDAAWGYPIGFQLSKRAAIEELTRIVRMSREGERVLISLNIIDSHGEVWIG